MPRNWGLISLRFLIGDFINCLFAWDQSRQGPLTAVVASHGAFSYLRELCEMAPIVEEIIPLDFEWDVRDSLSLESAYRAAAKQLQKRGVCRLAWFDMEHFPFGHPVPFFSPYFTEINLDDGQMVNGYNRTPVTRFHVPPVVEQWCTRFRKDHDLDRYIVVHNRESGWGARMKSQGSTCSNANINNMRNYTIGPALTACDHVLPKSWKIIRIGDASMQPVSRNNVLDITQMGLTLQQQAALIHHSQFYLGGGGGMMQVASAFGKPVVTINMAHRCGIQASADTTHIGLEKSIWKNGKRLSFLDVPLVDGGPTTSRIMEGLGYEIRDNTPEEIAGALNWMLKEMKNAKALIIDHNGHAHRLESWVHRFIGGVEPAFCRNHIQLLTQYEHALQPKPYYSYRCLDRWDNHAPLRIALYGAGRLGRKLARIFQRQTAWDLVFVESRPERIGRTIEGLTTLPGDRLDHFKPNGIIVSSIKRQTSIQEWLEKQGYRMDSDFITPAPCPDDDALYHLERLLCERFDLSAKYRIAFLPCTALANRACRRFQWRSDWAITLLDMPPGNASSGTALTRAVDNAPFDLVVLFTHEPAQWVVPWLTDRGFQHETNYIYFDDPLRCEFETNFLNPRAAALARKKRWVD